MNNNINNEFDNKMSQIIYYQLALENYEDLTGNHLNYLNTTHKKLGELRKNKNIWEEKKKIQIANDILEEFKNAVNKVGKNNFTFFNDIVIEYTGPNLLSKIN